MDDSHEPTTPPPTTHALPRGSETILVVDDDPDLRQTALRVLQRLGYKVMEAATPESALRLAKMSGVDLVIVDVILPMMSGLALAQALGTIRPAARTMYMSGYTNAEVLREVSGERPGVDFLPKPFTAELLATRVRKLLDKSQPHDSLLDATPRGDETVLVVDDDADLRRNVARMLERLGYRVLQAQDPDHALRIALQSTVSLIVMDALPPRMDGATLASTIAALRPKVRILYMSGRTTEELARELGVDASGLSLLEKPFTPDELGRKVRAMIDGAASTRRRRRAEGP